MKKIIFLGSLLLSFYGVSQSFQSQLLTYLQNQREAFGYQATDVDALFVENQSFSKSLNGHTVHATQMFQDIIVLNTTTSFLVKQGVVSTAKIGFQSNLNTRVSSTTPSISAAQALVAASNAMGVPASNTTLIESKENHLFVFDKGSISLYDIPVQLVLYPQDNGTIRLAWNTLIYTQDESKYAQLLIDAQTGTVLKENNLLLSCTFEGAHNHSETTFNTETLFNNEAIAVGTDPQYRVYPIPAESPNHGSDELLIDPSDATASPFGWHDTNGVAGAEFTITRGNNVYAQDDFDGNNNTTGTSADGGPDLLFDFVFDFTSPPNQSIEAATVNLFYMNNIMHDIWFHYGFDEENGAFQAFNYVEGQGTAGDAVIAQAQDGSGLNNANFGTPPDGSAPRMQMFLWSGAPANLLTINTGALAGDYSGLEANFGPGLSTTPLTADLALVDDSTGDAQDACQAITNGPDLSGKIVVIRRGGCEFGAKVLSAENQGAIAVIVVNNVPGGPIAMGPGAQGGSVTIPSIMVSDTDGEAIISALLNGDTVNASLQSATSIQIDGDLDNGIIAHEYGHGISNRLTGGPFNVGCLSNAEQMGEGWSDWFGLMLTIEPGDQPTDVRGIGTFALGQTTNGNGIRPAPYSTDFGVNGFTYGDTNNSSLSQPHGIGFVWATMLWDLTWALIDEYGFDPDFYNGSGGNNIAMQLVMDGLKLQSCSPGFVDGRDAILLADQQANGGANACLIWNVFANRGLGSSADQGSSSSRSDQTEAFDVPTSCQLGTTTPVLENPFVLYPNPAKQEVFIATKQALSEATITVFDLHGRALLTTQDNFNQNIVKLNTQSLQAGVYFVSITIGQNTHTTKLIIE